ncbi:hypothetical protein [Halobaculum marinum]|uniref:Uncharacterized protein n=1 Tax=Halobaculum marinum TaxID=3031996 RepID=A0ABD5WZ33_9EURY|nr:hypothetical protein [Halobaculum sp. DT55]
MASTDSTSDESTYGDLPADGRLDAEDLEGTELELLLRDHESAGEDARYRDRMVHTGFYLSLIFSGVLLNTGLTLHRTGQLLALSAVAAFGSLSFYVLWVWTDSFMGARNAAWNRRRQIEYEVDRHYPGLLKAHSDVFSRIQFTEADEFEHAGRVGRQGRSSSTLTTTFIQLIFAGAAVTSLAALGVWAVESTGSVSRGLLLAVVPFLVFSMMVRNVVVASGYFERSK